MREKRGFWFDSKSLEVIPVADHFGFLEDLEGKFRFDFSRTPDQERWGKALGMKPGFGWNLPKPLQRKHTFMLEALKKGWVRIRGHSDMPRMTIEFWKKTDDLMAALGVAAKEVARKGETLELHEVSTNTPWLVPAAELMAGSRGGGELVEPGIDPMRELWAQAVQANPSAKKLRASGKPGKGGAMRIYSSLIGEGMHIRGNPFDHSEYDNPGPDFEASEVGFFTADSPALCFGGRFGKMASTVSNPEEIEKFIEPKKGEGPSVAQFFLGLTRGLGTRKNSIIKPSWIIEFVKARRKAQLPKKLPGGASFVMQRGFFTDWSKQHLHPNEKSLQVLIYPEFDGGETLRTFERNMGRLGMLLRREFDQRSVILNLVVNGRQKFLGAYKWTDPSSPGGSAVASDKKSK